MFNIAAGGTSANPPHLGHLELVLAVMMSGLFSEVNLIPCGRRNDKDIVIEPEHRLAMLRYTFFDSQHPHCLEMHKLPPKVTFSLCLDDINGHNRPTINWMDTLRDIYYPSKVFWFTGVDPLVPKHEFGGKCEMQAKWIDGERLYREHNFIVTPRQGYPHPSSLNLPGNFQVLNFERPLSKVSSTDIRFRIRKGQSFLHLVTPEVAAYIRANNLYGYKKR